MLARHTWRRWNASELRALFRLPECLHLWFRSLVPPGKIHSGGAASLNALSEPRRGQAVFGPTLPGNLVGRSSFKRLWYGSRSLQRLSQRLRQREEPVATTAYEKVLHAAQRLTPAERTQLLRELATLDRASGDGSGAAFVDALLATPPLDPAGLDAMERAIGDGCERIDARDW